MLEINYLVIRFIKMVKSDLFYNYDLYYVCEIGSIGLGNLIFFIVEKEFLICEYI